MANVKSKIVTHLVMEAHFGRDSTVPFKDLSYEQPEEAIYIAPKRPAMDFDPRDLIEANLNLLQEAAGLAEPEPALLMTVATWGRGADPELLKALQPHRHGLGFNGSVVARVPIEWAREWIPGEAFVRVQGASDQTLVYSAVFKDWVLEPL